MSLLDEIQTAATDPAHPLADLLRKCQILAFRLRHQPFKEWVSHELGGYPDEVPLPPYRSSLLGELKADLAGPFGAAGKNVPVPVSLIPEEFRDNMRRFNFYQPVAVLESLVEGAKQTGDTRIMSPVPVEISSLIRIWQGYQTMTMWLEVPIASVAGVLDAVRSRALEFVLEIEAENPEAGATATKEPPVALERADAIFNTVIFGGQNAVGPGATVQVVQGDLGSLMVYLETQGVASDDRKELEAALAADKGKLGPRVKGWLGSMAVKATSSGGRITESAVAGLAAAAIARFLGIG